MQINNGGRKRKKDIHDGKRIQRVEYELLHCRPCIGIDYIPTKIRKLSGIRAKNLIDRFTYLLEIIDKEDGWDDQMRDQLTRFTYKLETTDAEDGVG